MTGRSIGTPPEPANATNEASAAEMEARPRGKRPRILGVGCLLNNEETLFEKFRSNATFLDYDVVIWDPATTIAEYSRDYGSETYRGLPSLSEDDSVRFVSDIERRAAEIQQLLGLGRTVIVFVSEPQSCYVDTGQRRTSGTGRNAKVTRIVDDVDLYTVLPVAIEVVTASGSYVELRAGEPFAAFWRQASEFLAYRACFEVEGANPVFYIENTDRVVGAVMRQGRGLLLLLPAPVWDQGTQDNENVEAEQALVDALVELVQHLREETGDFTLPGWAAGYELPAERAQRDALAQRERDRDALLAAMDEEKRSLAALDQRKILFTGSGVALELQVKAVFVALGFTVTDAAPGRDDLVAERGGRVAVVEVKGVAKSGAEKHAAQLEKWVAGHYADHGRQPKGILVVNAYADTPLRERTSPAFPDQMLAYSVGRGHVLVTGLQLLGAWLDVEARPEAQEGVATSLLDAVGLWDRYADWTTFMSTPVATDLAVSP